MSERDYDEHGKGRGWTPPSEPPVTADHTCAGCACQAEHDGDYGAPGHPGPCPPHTCPVTADHTPRCRCANDGHAHRCPIHTQEDFNAADRAREGVTADHTPERQPTLPFTLRMPTNRVDNPDGGSLNTGTNHVDVQVILDPDMKLRGECRSGYAGPVIALREWDEQVFLHELLHAAVAYAQPLVATTHPPHGHEVIARVEVALWETGWRLAPAGRRPVTTDHTPERLNPEEALARELYARGGGILWEGEESWQDHYLGVARDVLASDWSAALRAECDVLREQTTRVEALANELATATNERATITRWAVARRIKRALHPQDHERASG